MTTAKSVWLVIVYLAICMHLCVILHQSSDVYLAGPKLFSVFFELLWLNGASFLCSVLSQCVFMLVYCEYF